MKTLCLEITNAYFSVIIIFCIAEEIHSMTWIIMIGSNKDICHAPNKGNGPFASIFRPVSVIASTLLTSMILLHEFFLIMYAYKCYNFECRVPSTSDCSMRPNY